MKNLIVLISIFAFLAVNASYAVAVNVSNFDKSIVLDEDKDKDKDKTKEVKAEAKAKSASTCCKGKADHKCDPSKCTCGGNCDPSKCSHKSGEAKKCSGHTNTQAAPKTGCCSHGKK